MDVHGIKNAPDLVQRMYDAKILLYPDGAKTDTQKRERRNSAIRSVDNHLNGKMPETEWIKRYCNFFDCSADYLLGFILLPNHSATDISDYTGLSETAIGILHKWKSTAKGVLNLTLSVFIDNEKDAFDILRSIWAYYALKKRSNKKNTDNTIVIDTENMIPSKEELLLWTATNKFTEGVKRTFK